jgi:hypothetical protein
LGQIRVTFVLDSSKLKGGNGGVRRSEIYTLLNLWRTLVRAGRGEMSTEFALALDKNFCVNHAFDITVHFLGGVDISQALNDTTTSTVGLEETQIYQLKNCWLSSFGIGPELSFSGGGAFATVTAILFAEDIQPIGDRHPIVTATPA